MSLVSIIIPAYEMYGEGENKLRTLLNSIKIQKFRDFEVILSDHSKEGIFKNISQEFSNFFNLKYFIFTEKYNNGPANTNHCIDKSSGEFIKPMFQDDYFRYDFSLEKMINPLVSDNDKKWLATSIIHCGDNDNNLYRPYQASWLHADPFIWNTYRNKRGSLGSPSMVIFKNSDKLRFDENLVQLMDVDMWFQVGKLYGSPICLSEMLIVVRVWSKSVGAIVGSGCIAGEYNYLEKKWHDGKL